MAIDLKEFELRRIVDMLRGFEWTVVKSGFLDDKVSVDFEKTIIGVGPEVRKGEADRINNLLKSFNWTQVSQEFVGDKIVLRFEKVVKGEVS